VESERDALVAQVARLEDTVRTQDALLTAAAHDLKNSLAAITLRADLLLGQLEDDLQVPDGQESLSFRKGLARIVAASSQMARLLDELLGLGRLQAGHRLDLEREPMDLVALARRVVGEYVASWEHERIRLTTTQAELIGVWDAWRLERVLRNLLSNAVKYSPDGGEISVRLGTERDDAGDWAVLAVADHGLGIPDPDLASVFERFHRGANVRGRIAGTGIGLAGANQIVLEHGGSLLVESQEGVGSTFTVRLPCAPTVDQCALSVDQPGLPGLRRLPGAAQASSGEPDDTAAVLGVLSAIGLLAPVPAAALAHLAEQSSIRRFATGTVLVRQGDVSESLFLVVTGRVRVEQTRAFPSTPVRLGELGVGEVIGEMGALDRERRSATVIAVEDTQAVEIPATALVGILLGYHEVGAALLRGLSRRLRLADERVAH
jgi:nitrogen-specific signal transduction histidine kinase